MEYTVENLSMVLHSGALVRRKDGGPISTRKGVNFFQLLILKQHPRIPSKDVGPNILIINCKVLAFFKDGTTHEFHNWNFMIGDFVSHLEVISAD